MRTLKLVVDIDRTADGHIEGRIQAPGEPALPFSGRLELLRAIEDALPAAEEAALAPDVRQDRVVDVASGPAQRGAGQAVCTRRSR
jgi:hypothetical protein